MAESWPIVGRGVEVTAILGRLYAGVGTVIVGEAGVGKTALAREVQRQMNAAGWRTKLLLCGVRRDFPLFAVTVSTDVGRRSLLLVDDAHLLDDDSAETLARIVGTETTQVLATIRSGVKVPDRIARLWSGSTCERLDLRPLAEADIRLLLERLLGGDVEDRLPRLLVQRAAGNALVLRELIRSGVDSGAIVRSHQVWRLAGSLPVGGGVADLIRDALSGLTDGELEVAQLIALGEPLRLPVAVQEVGESILEALEARHILAVQDTADGPTLTLTHPLYGEVLRADLATLRSRRLRRRLVAAIRATASATQRDILRSALWRVELRDPIDVAELIVAARLARSISSATAELLARAAIRADKASVEAVMLLAEILSMQGRIAEAGRLLDGIDVQALGQADRQAVLYERALGRTRLGEVREAAAMISATAVEANSLQVQAMYAQALMFDGRLSEAVTVARPLFADESADDVSRTLAAFTLVAGGTFIGNIAEAEQVMQSALPLAEATRAALPYGIATVKVSAVIGLSTAGRLDDAEQLAHEMYDQALSDDDEWMRPRGASALGVTALMRGRARTATRYFRITVASLNDFDGLFLRYNLSYLARAAALSGLTEEARRALQSPTDAPRFPLFDPDWQMAEAAVLAADGNLSAASERALQAARTAASFGGWAAVLHAAHDAVRYGASDEAVHLAATAADRLSGPLPRCVNEHAQARAANDAPWLAELSHRFEDVGAILYAAESAYAAGRSYRRATDGHAAARIIVRAMELHARCEDAVIPWISGFRSVAALTRREQQIALLAAAGHPDTVIAGELQLSIRTVQNHLGRAYTKLGITNRRSLPEALT